MLTIGETYNERKAAILDNILVCRGLIKECNKIAQKRDSNRDLALEVIKNENDTIRMFVKELVDLEKWRIANSYDKDDSYHPKGANYGKE